MNVAYPNGESHVPLHLDVRQTAFTWDLPGYDNIAGLHFVIMNHGSQRLTEIRMGMVANLDVRDGDEAHCDLISRNGQDVASGVYLFTVEAPDSHQVGRFVILR